MPRWALLTAPKGAPKTARLLDVIARLRARGLRVGGFVQAPLVGQEGPEGHQGYLARALHDDATEAIARRARASDEGQPGAQLICSYAFDADALARTRRWIERDARACAVVVLDELAKLEVARGGHHDAVLAALAGPALPLLSVRADQLFAIMERFGLDAPIAALEGDDEAERASFVEAILNSTGGLAQERP
jgi:nucleoside-triphosphatase THEP1